VPAGEKHAGQGFGCGAHTVNQNLPGGLLLWLMEGRREVGEETVKPFLRHAVALGNGVQRNVTDPQAQGGDHVFRGGGHQSEVSDRFVSTELNRCGRTPKHRVGRIESKHPVIVVERAPGPRESSTGVFIRA